MKNKKKLYSTVLSFMMVFPFRLPISVALVVVFDKIVNLVSEGVPVGVLCSNIVITKCVYNVIVGAWFVNSFEKLLIEQKGRRAIGFEYGKDTIYIWTIFIAIGTLGYAVYDAFTTYQIFYAIHN